MKMPSRLEFGGAAVRAKGDLAGKLVKAGQKKKQVEQQRIAEDVRTSADVYRIGVSAPGILDALLFRGVSQKFSSNVRRELLPELSPQVRAEFPRSHEPTSHVRHTFAGLLARIRLWPQNHNRRLLRDNGLLSPSLTSSSVYVYHRTETASIPGGLLDSTRRATDSPAARAL